MLLSDDERLVTHSYVLVETTALAQRRLGLGAVRALRDALFPLLGVVWVDRDLHAGALTATLAARRRDVSLVDHVSFEIMRRRALTRAFAFDAHFAGEGFETVG